jgi:hypothetical protein
MDDHDKMLMLWDRYRPMIEEMYNEWAKAAPKPDEDSQSEPRPRIARPAPVRRGT